MAKDLLEHNDARLVVYGCSEKLYIGCAVLILAILKRTATAAIPVLSLRTTLKLLTSTGIAPFETKTSPTALGSISKDIWRIMLDNMRQFDCDCLDGLVVSRHLLFQLPKPNGYASFCPGKS